MARRSVSKREAILSAAFVRFSRYGFRRTSMEDIAAEAGMSRAALYLEFQNKEDIFRALSQSLHEEALGRAAAALAGEGPLATRLQAAVEGKSLGFVEIAYASPHGAELLDESSRLCGDQAAAAERRFLDLLAKAVRRAAAAEEVDLGRAGLSAAGFAELLVRAVSGLKGPGVTGDVFRNRVAALVRVFLGGLSPAGRRGNRPAARTSGRRARA
jgi:AcrR family transcriptional regulator